MWWNHLILQVWHVADVPKNDKFQYTHFAHKINSFDTAPKKLLPSDSRLRPDRYALEHGDLSKAGAEKSRYCTVQFVCQNSCFTWLLLLLNSKLNLSLSRFQFGGEAENWKETTRGQGRSVCTKMVWFDWRSYSHTLGWIGSLPVQRDILRTQGHYWCLRLRWRGRC